jgi:hypothetical protein
MGKIIQVEMPVAAGQRVVNRQPRAHLALRRVLSLLGGDELKRVESVFQMAGRVIGVVALFPQTPCRSGFPSAVRGTCHAVPAVAVRAASGDLAVTVSAADPTARRTANNCFTSGPPDKKCARSPRRCHCPSNLSIAA